MIFSVESSPTDISQLISLTGGIPASFSLTDIDSTSAPVDTSGSIAALTGACGSFIHGNKPSLTLSFFRGFSGSPSFFSSSELNPTGGATVGLAN